MYRNVLNSRLILEPSNHISSFDLVSLGLGVLLNEFVDVHESSTNSHQELVSLFNLDVDSFLTELVNALTFSKEHDLEVSSLWVPVQIVS